MNNEGIMKSTIDRLIRNIQVLMKEKGIENVTELARRTRIPQPTMHRLISGEIKEPKYSLLKQVASYFKVPVSEIVEKDIGSSKLSSNVIKAEEKFQFRAIPVLGKAQLGSEGYWEVLEYPIGYGDGYIKWPTRDPDAFAFKCTGDSMKPRIKNGEYVVIEPNHTYLPGDEVFIKTSEGEAMVKTFLYERDGVIVVISINENHPPLHFDINKIEKILYVGGIAKPSLYDCL